MNAITKRYLTPKLLKMAYEEYAAANNMYVSSVSMFEQHRKVAVFNFLNKYDDSACQKMIADIRKQATKKAAKTRARNALKGK